MQGDQEAWTGLQLCLGELMRGWLRGHPRREAALRWESEENYVALAFERFWQATVQQQVVFRTLAGALAYLRASLNGALLDTLRAYARPREVPLPEPGAPGEPDVEDRLASLELWEILQSVLPSEREQRLAYLLYHCNLKPREIVRFCQEEWPDVQEVYRLRRNILERLLRKKDQLRRRFHLQEQG
jgi:DNA-directed RNA polymerase specialized sigma24 family protein